jgi:hypothetical protein
MPIQSLLTNLIYCNSLWLLIGMVNIYFVLWLALIYSIQYSIYTFWFGIRWLSELFILVDMVWQGSIAKWLFMHALRTLLKCKAYYARADREQGLDLHKIMAMLFLS